MPIKWSVYRVTSKTTNSAFGTTYGTTKLVKAADVASAVRVYENYYRWKKLTPPRVISVVYMGNLIEDEGE